MPKEQRSASTYTQKGAPTGNTNRHNPYTNNKRLDGTTSNNSIYNDKKPNSEMRNQSVNNQSSTTQGSSSYGKTHNKPKITNNPSNNNDNSENMYQSQRERQTNTYGPDCETESDLQHYIHRQNTFVKKRYLH